MTSEIVILNREAVAIAADSAVTLSNGKIYNTANKVFMLSDKHPVGVLIYNQTSYLGLPWEILINDFGKYLSETNLRKEKLEEYFDEFNNWLITNNDKYCTEDQEDSFMEYISQNTLIDIGQEIWKGIWNHFYEKAEKISEKRLLKLIKLILQNKIDELKKLHEYFTEDQRKKIAIDINRKFGKQVEQHRKKLFENIPFDKDDLKKINEIIYLTFTRESEDMFSGIVFAGYGDNDLMPTCISYRYEDPICRFIKRKKNEDECMNISVTGGTVAGIVPLAQKDVIHNFLFGIHPDLFSILKNLLKKKMSENEYNNTLNTLDNKFILKHKDSILRAVNSLPKEELATMAETLIATTSFMRKVSMDPDTVGGPVDVAVISRSDGFVWITKKMYYSNEKNLHLKNNH